MADRKNIGQNRDVGQRLYAKSKRNDNDPNMFTAD